MTIVAHKENDATKKTVEKQFLKTIDFILPFFVARVHTVDLPDSQGEGEVAKATPSEVADTVATVRSPQPQTRPKKKMLNEVSEHDPGEVNNDRDPGVWEGQWVVHSCILVPYFWEKKMLYYA